MLIFNMSSNKKGKVKKVKVKECSKCENLLQLSSFQDRKRNKDGKDNLCRACRNDYLGMWREQKFSENPYKSLLLSSVHNCFNRGQVGYTVSPYQDTLCNWDSANSFFNDLYNDEVWMEDWRKQVDIYLETGDDGDKPSIDRQNASLHYSRNNIRVLSLSANKAEAVSKPCQVWIIKNKNMADMEFLELPSKKELRKTLEEREISYMLMRSIDEGIIHDVGNGMQVLIQTTDGELKQHDEPLYEATIHYQRYLIDYETNQEYLIIDNKYNFETGGIRLNKNQKGVIGVTPF